MAPKVMAVSAKLKAGQKEKSRKSMTNFLSNLSMRLPTVPARKKARAVWGKVSLGIWG